MKYTKEDITNLFEAEDETVGTEKPEEEELEDLDIEGFFNNLYQAFGVKPSVNVKRFISDNTSTDQASTKRSYLKRFIENGGMLRVKIVDSKKAEQEPISLEKQGSYLVLNIPNKQKKEE